MTRDSKPPSASAWRRPVLDHDLLFTFPFRVKLKKSEDLAKKTSVLIKQEGWQHWLQSGLDNPDGTELYEAYDASRDFFVEIRRVLFPELNILLPDELKFFTREPNDPAKSKSVELLSARISKRIGDLDKGDKGGFGQAMLRLRRSGGIVGREIQVQIKDRTYNICIEYIDVCLFPDANAVLVIRLRGLRHANGTNLTSYEAGLAVRSLKLIEYRVRNRVSAPKFKDGNDSFSWADLLKPLIEPWAGSFAKIAAESAAPQFRVVSFARIHRDISLHSATNNSPFRTARERLHFELATGHDTSDTQELPTAELVNEIRSTALVRQWEAFDVLVLWEDATFLIEDRTGSSDLPLLEGSNPDRIDRYAQEDYPRKIRQGFIWLMVIVNYQEAKLLEFLKRLSALTNEVQHDLDPTLDISGEYVKFANLYRHRAVTPSQSGKSVFSALTSMFELEELESTVGVQLERAKTHYESQLANRAAKASRTTQFAITAFGIIGLTVGIVAAVLQNSLGQADFVKKGLGANGSWIVLIGSIIVSVAVAVLVWTQRTGHQTFSLWVLSAIRKWHPPHRLRHLRTRVILMVRKIERHGWGAASREHG